MRADVVLGWSFASVPEQARGAFKRPTRFVSIPTPANRGYRQQAYELGWPHAIAGALKKYAPDVEPLRVALLGFSESCHGVRNLLSSGDGARVDSVVAIDGVHTPYLGKEVDPNTMKPWVAFGEFAAVNERLMIVTHSSVVPPNFASTTETAEYLWFAVAEGSEPLKPQVPFLDILPHQIKIGGNPKIVGPARTVDYPEAVIDGFGFTKPWKAPKRKEGLIILGCENLDVPRGTADHIYQAKYVLPEVTTKILADRWNAIDPDNPSGVCWV